ncbi:MAG TPA: carbon-nitrogen hydrolase family protein [Anaerolineae bacterium]|nr:carbon-nitrogen hydrolase family protein [Anaerolineae bacterium]
MKIRVAVGQMRSTGDMKANLQIIEDLLAIGRQRKARLLVLPECSLTGYGPAVYDGPHRFDEKGFKQILEDVRKAAARMRIGVVAGAAVKQSKGWMNAAVLIGPNGKICGRYDKAHLYGEDARYYLPGSRAKVHRIMEMRLGMQVCFDLRFPEPFRDLALRCAQVIAVPSYICGADGMWKRPVIEAHIRSRAAENGRFILFANAAGPDQNVPSMVADPRGEILAQSSLDRPELITVDIDLAKVDNNLLRSRRTDLARLVFS